MNFQIEKDKGYIALFSTIILIAVFLLLFVGIFTMVIGGMDRIAGQEKAFRTGSTANICIEETLNEIRKDPDFPIEGIYFEEAGASCTIKNAQYPENNRIIFYVEGEYFEYLKVIEIEVLIEENLGERSVTINSWKEDVSI